MDTKSFVIGWLKREEGFSDKPYTDILGVPTIGYGFTYLTDDEAETVLKMKIEKIQRKLALYLAQNEISIDEFRFGVLTDMIYNLGMDGALKFRKMWKALKHMNYEEAADQMLDSRWHKQVPERCELLARRMRDGY